MLKVVQPPTGGQGDGASKRRYRRSPALSLTDVERMRLRAALRNLRALYGTWGCLAAVMGVSKISVQRIASGHDSGSHATAQRAAKAAGTTIERLLGKPVAADRCPHCGRTG